MATVAGATTEGGNLPNKRKTRSLSRDYEANHETWRALKADNVDWADL